MLEAILAMCMTNEQQQTHCHIVQTELTSVVTSHGECLDVGKGLQSLVKANAKIQFPELKFHSETVFCGSTDEYVGAVTSLLRSNYADQGYTFYQEVIQ